MKLSSAEEYAMRLTMALASAGRQLSVLELAERERLPEPTVAKVLSALRAAGVVRAQRGRGGGYELAVAPEELTVAAVLATFNEPLFMGRFCQSGEREDPSCVHQSDCGLRPVWRRLEALIGGFLARVTVADVLASESRSREVVARHGAAQLPVVEN